MLKVKFTALLISVLIMCKVPVNGQEAILAPGLDVIGYGYDIFGQFADMKSKKRYCLFQFTNYKNTPIGSYEYKVPQYVILENMSDHVVKTVDGSSIRSYSKSLSASAGLSYDGFLFGGSVEAQYGTSESGTEQKYYFTYMDANTKWRISFDDRNIENLIEILEPQAKKDIETMDPEKLFETYGTHIIIRAYLGGRADFTSESTISSKISSEQISTAVTAKYGSISGKASLSTTNENTLTNSKTTTKLRVVGGNSEFASNIQNADQYRDWASGIEKKPVLCDFDENSLMAIWEFASTDERKKQLEDAFEELCKTKPLPAHKGIISDDLCIFSKLDGNIIMDCEGGKTDVVGTFLQTWMYNNGKGQIFQVEDGEEAGTIKIKTKGGLFIGVEGDALENNATIVLLDGTNNYKSIYWKKELAGDGFYYLINANSGKALSIPDDKNQKDLHLIQTDLTKSDGQKWMLIEKDGLFEFGKKLYESTWSKGWTTTQFDEIKGSPYLFHYKNGSGDAKNSALTITSSSISLNDAYKSTWSTGWTTYNDFVYKDGTNYHLTLKSETGEVHLDKYGFDGKPVNTWKDDWSSGWTTIEVFDIGNQYYFLHYKKSDGTVRIGKLCPNPCGNIWETKWPKNINSIQHYSIGSDHYVFVLSLEGLAWIFKINGSGDNLSLVKTWSINTWEANISGVEIVNYNFGPVLFLFKNQTGKMWAAPLGSDGKLGSYFRTQNWSTGWTDFDSYRKDGKTYFLMHKESGLTRILQIN